MELLFSFFTFIAISQNNKGDISFLTISADAVFQTHWSTVTMNALSNYYMVKGPFSASSALRLTAACLKADAFTPHTTTQLQLTQQPSPPPPSTWHCAFLLIRQTDKTVVVGF